MTQASLPVASHLAALLRVLRWNRRWIAALAAFVAVAAGLNAVQPARATTVGVMVAARELPGGTHLAAGDLVRLELPPNAVPAGSHPDAAPLIGRTINAPVSARSPITDATTSTGSALARPGFVVLSVPVSDAATTTLVQAGTRVDLISRGKGVIAADVRVVGTPNTEPGGLISSGSRGILVELTPDAAAKVAAATETGGLTVAIR